MSLLTTPILQALYNNILQQGAHEHHSKTFWTHVLRTEFITTKDAVIATESPPTPLANDALRRVDFHVSTFNQYQKLQVVAICEIKRMTGSTDEVESQLQQACEACVRYTKDDVFGIAVIGTKAQVFQYTTTNRFYSITGGYIDANSQDATKLGDAFRTINGVITKPTVPTVPDGWYDVGDGTGKKRYFRNGAWTDHYS